MLLARQAQFLRTTHVVIQRWSCTTVVFNGVLPAPDVTPIVVLDPAAPTPLFVLRASDPVSAAPVARADDPRNLLVPAQDTADDPASSWLEAWPI